MTDPFDEVSLFSPGVVESRRVDEVPDPPPVPPAVAATVKGKPRRGSETRLLAGRIPIRLTESERREADAAAAAAGQSIGDYLRDAALTEPETRRGEAHVTRRGQITYLRVSAEQRARIEGLAERAGISIGSYIRARGLKRPVTLTTRRPPVEKAELARLLALMGRVSGNLYQLVRAQNFGNEVRAVDAAEAIADVRAAATEIIRTLGREPGGREPDRSEPGSRRAG